MTNVKRYSLNWIEDIIENGYIFSHIAEMNILSVIDKMHKTYDYYINHPMQTIELKLNMIFAKNPHLLSSFNRSHIYLLIRKYSHSDKRKLIITLIK